MLTENPNKGPMTNLMALPLGLGFGSLGFVGMCDRVPFGE